MKLEPIIQSEVSQKEKHQYNILTHIYGSQLFLHRTDMQAGKSIGNWSSQGTGGKTSART